MHRKLIVGAGLAACAATLAAPARAADADSDAGPALPPLVVVGRPAETASTQTPVVTATIGRDDIAHSVNAVNTEDALKYLPNVLVRKRHIGDTQAPIATRTSGVGSSARSLIYGDGVLLSALIGNNNSTASPRWGLVAPQEIERIDVAYGPFAAAYPGNSIGAVVNIVTRMPTRLEAGVDVVGAWQGFHQYATRDTYGSGQISAYVGDRVGPVALWLSGSHLDARGQPLAFATLATPANPSAAGAPASGAVADLNRTGGGIEVLGATSLERQRQDNAKLKVSLDLGGAATATYSLGFFSNVVDATAQTYLTGAAGQPVWSGAVNIGGRAFTIPASAFSGGVYHFDEKHLGQGLKLASRGAGPFRWEATASLYLYLRDRQGIPNGALPAAATGGAGSLTDMAGTGWGTLDLKGVWRSASSNELSFGLHGDQVRLKSNRFNTGDWRTGPEGSLASSALGQTRTLAAWAQDAWDITPALKLTAGARLEAWRASGGLNFSASPALNVAQPALTATNVSPKLALTWTPAAAWRLSAAYGEAYRYPTVQELYQAVTVGTTLVSPDPSLRPEHARSVDLTAERAWTGGHLRLSAFGEWVGDALVSQTAPITPGAATLVSFTQNIGQTRVLGIEAVAEQRDVLVKGLTLSGSITYADPVVTRDAAFPAAQGHQLIQVPRWRVTGLASWQATPRLTLTGAVRYSTRVYATLNNADIVTHTYQGFDSYLLADLRMTYRLTDHLMAAVGIDNAGGDNYFLFHPFPQRTVVAEVKWTL